MSHYQSISTRQSGWKCFVGLLLALYLGAREKLHTPRTWVAVFLHATDTGGDDLTAIGDRWRRTPPTSPSKKSCLVGIFWQKWNYNKIRWGYDKVRPNEVKLRG